MRFWVLAVGAVCGATTAGSAAAQQSLPAVQQERQLDFGVRAETTYDNNAARGTRALAQQRAVAREDVVFQPTVTADVTQPFGSHIVFLHGEAGYDFHRENDQLDRGRADIYGGYTTAVGPCQPTAMAAYRAAQSDLQDADALTIDNLLQSTTTTLSLQCQQGVGLGASALVSRTETKNSATLRKTSDSTTEAASLSLVYGNATLGQAALIWNYTNTEFPNRIIPGRPVGDGFFTTSYGASYQRNFGPRISVGGQVQRTTVKREFAPPGVDAKFTSTTYGANASYRLGTRIQLQANAGRSVKPSNRPGKVYDIATTGEMVASYRLGSRYNVSLGHRIDDIESNVDLPPGARPVVTDSRSNTTFGAIRYAQSDRVTWTLDAAYEDRKTNLPDFNYNSTRVSLAVAVGF